MKKLSILLLALLFFFIYFSKFDIAQAKEKINHVRRTPLFTEKSSNVVKLKLFYTSTCKYCIALKKDFLPKIISKYKDKIEIEYLNIADRENFKLYLALEKEFNVKMRVPSILVGNKLLVGSTQIKDNLESILDSDILKQHRTQISQIDLLQKFLSFSPLAIILAGLIDGINPCAFTVLIFFISFLSLMGYKKKELIVVGLSFIFAVFLTYLAIGLGLFRGLYELKQFYIFLKITYYVLAAFCFILAYLNLLDFLEYRKTKSADSMRVKLPKSVRTKINSIIGMFYRRDTKDDKPVVRLGLITATFVVGFLISLLEAVCTGQVYLPTIVFILKEPNLRLRALSYLLLYNFMFVFPLLLILLLAILGVSSKKLEEFFRKKIALIKFSMFLLFIGLGIFLIIGS